MWRFNNRNWWKQLGQLCKQQWKKPNKTAGEVFFSRWVIVPNIILQKLSSDPSFGKVFQPSAKTENQTTPVPCFFPEAKTTLLHTFENQLRWRWKTHWSLQCLGSKVYFQGHDQGIGEPFAWIITENNTIPSCISSCWCIVIRGIHCKVLDCPVTASSFLYMHVAAAKYRAIVISPGKMTYLRRETPDIEWLKNTGCPIRECSSLCIKFYNW